MCRDRKGATASTLAYADSFGEGGARGLASYYLASAADKVRIDRLNSTITP